MLTFVLFYFNELNHVTTVYQISHEESETFWSQLLLKISAFLAAKCSTMLISGSQTLLCAGTVT